MICMGTQSATRIDDYANTAGKSRDGTLAGHRKQAGDPSRGARAIIVAVEAGSPPVHLLIGGDALDQFRGKLDALRQETDTWEMATRSTDFAPLRQPNWMPCAASKKTHPLPRSVRART